MLHIATPLTNLTDTVTRPVALSVIRDLMKQTLVPSGTPVSFPGASGQLAQRGSTIDYHGSQDVIFGDRSKYTIQVNERIEEDQILRRSRTDVHSNAVFYDKHLGIRMNPIYSPTVMTIEIEYQCEDENEAQAWKNDMEYRIGLGRQNMVHDASYAFLIPREYIVILGQIYTLREAQGGYNESLAKYFSDCFGSYARITTALDGNAKAYEVPQHQNTIVGALELSDLPDFEQKDGSANKTVSLTYTFNYDRPMGMQLHYPAIIHNQLLDKKYRPIPKRFNGFEFHVGSRTNERARFDNMRAIANGYTVPNIINSPAFDVWEPQNSPKGYLPFLSVLTRVDVNDPRALCNLADLGPVNLSETSLNYAKEHYEQLTQLRNTPLWVGVYSGDETWLKQTSVTIDSDLNVRTNYDMSVRKTYRVVIGVLTDLSLLSPKALDALLTTPDFTLDLLEGLQPSLKDNNELPKVVGGKVLNKDQFNQAVKKVTSTFDHVKNDKLLTNVWVGNFVVSAGNE